MFEPEITELEKLRKDLTDILQKKAELEDVWTAIIDPIIKSLKYREQQIILMESEIIELKNK